MSGVQYPGSTGRSPAEAEGNAGRRVKNEFGGVKRGKRARTDVDSWCELNRNSVPDAKLLACGKTAMSGNATGTIALVAADGHGLRDRPTESGSSLRSA